MNSNYYNGQSEITYSKIAKLSEIPEGIIKTHLSKKDENGKFVFKDNPIFLNWEYFYVDGKTHIKYKMNVKPKNYFILRNDFILDKNLTPKEKDFLLKFMAICTNNTHYLKASKQDIKAAGVSCFGRRTIKPFSTVLPLANVIWPAALSFTNRLHAFSFIS